MNAMNVFQNIYEISEFGSVRTTSLKNGCEIKGSVRYGDTVYVELSVSTRLLTNHAVMNVRNDEDGASLKVAMELLSRNNMYLTFACEVDTKQICRDSGLFFWCIKIQTYHGDFYISRKHDGTVELSEQEKEMQLTVYSADYAVPDRFRGGIMYHIFPDRFNIGNERIKKSHAVNVEKWDSPIPEYADTPGGDVENDYFYGGNLYGIADKAEYLASLGINYIYLCPVFESRSNHKYDTGNYMAVDECFGGDKGLCCLIKTMRKYGISVILDGVFNHTGDDSIYFNKRGRYNSVGAYNSKESPYYGWYIFEDHPQEYRCWWGIKILPKVNTENKYFTEYICGKYGVIGKYLKMGAEGFRLDVADELADSFIENLRRRLKIENPQAVLLGEVWEDASNKTAYGKRRRYFQGHQLDSVMNYPLREGIIDYLLKCDSEKLADICLSQQYNYPEFVFNSLMNFLSTHDTERIISVLCDEGIENFENSRLASHKASAEKMEKAKVLLKIGYVLLYTLPGVPSIYYGDEAGLQGGRDPFNRLTFPWGDEDKTITEYVRRLGFIRKGNNIFSHGTFKILEYRGGIFCFERSFENEKMIICANMSEAPYELYNGAESFDALNECKYDDVVTLAPKSVVLCEKN